MTKPQGSRVEASSDIPVVLHLFNMLEPGGAEMRTLEAIEALRGRNIRFVMGVTGMRGGALEQRFSAAGADIVTIPLGARFVWSLRKAIKEHGVTVLHAHSATASGYFMLLAALLGVPRRIAHFRSDSDGKPDTLPRRVRRCVLRVLIRTFATDVLGVTPKALEFAGSWTRRSQRAHFLPSGLVTPTLPSDALMQEIRREAGVEEGELLLVHVGRGGPVKNRARAIEILGAARAADVRARLVMVGRYETDERRSLENLATSVGAVGRITFAGQLSSVEAHLAAADLLLVTSLREGMPGVVLESVALGTPVVSSDVSGAVLISQHFRQVTCLSLNAPNSIWVQAIRNAVHPISRAQRKHALEEFSRSRFSMALCAEDFFRVWSFGRQRIGKP